ncbi:MULTISPECIES: ATP-binding cassette domain-containing protein [Bacillaceae]|uniref:ABC transporter domain-containing protein n=1 Tax=Alkalicoccobacillus plakortidis TaxID=444060 RepID=A0A9D5HZQ8_9BACI|nr:MULTISPECIES: ATP-binding cassette domain-containing protein [Bacillaceae]KQL55816.1 hypothetical protein AN965_16125 [Alkalicoccobacillus plakortidis]
MMYSFEVKGVHKNYGRKQVFTDISFRFDQNRFIVLLGSNGSGKSTMLKLCAGLAPFSKGEIRLGDASSRIERAQNASYVAEGVGYPAYQTAATILTQQKKLYPEFNQEQALHYCHEVSVPTQVKWGSLSTGQRHLLALIVAISTQKPFLFIDELLANLDTTKKEAMQGILTDFLLDGNRTIVMATHAYEDVEMLADGAMFIKDDDVTTITDLEGWRQEHGASLRDLFARVGRA